MITNSFIKYSIILNSGVSETWANQAMISGKRFNTLQNNEYSVQNKVHLYFEHSCKGFSTLPLLLIMWIKIICCHLATRMQIVIDFKVFVHV